MKKTALKFGLVFCLTLTVLFSFQAFKSSAETPITKYGVDVGFDENTKTLNCVENISYTNNYETSLNNLVLHLYPNSYKSASNLPTIGSGTRPELTAEQIGWIKISEVLIDNKPVEFNSDSQLLKLNLTSPLEKGMKIDLKISFTVKIPAGTDRMGYMNDVYSVTYWYPIMSIYNPKTNTWDENDYNPIGESNYSDVADYNVTLKTPQNIITAATGTVTDENTSVATKTIKIYAHKVRDFVFMMSKYFKIYSTTEKGVKINSYYIYNEASKDTQSVAKYLLKVAADSEKFYSSSYGSYPYPTLNIVETYLSGGAMEYPALIQMGKYQQLSTEDLKNHSSWQEDAVAHEIGHQWWYVAVGNNEFQEPLMDESINTFSTAYYFEKRYGEYNANSITMKFRNNLVTGALQPINSSVDKFNTWGEYSKVIYQRGPEIFQDLRARLGDTKFLKVLSTYFSRFEFKNGSIKDFANVVGEISDAKTQQYFEDSVSSANYCPNNISITPIEKKHIDNIDLISDLQNRETTMGLTISSIILRGLNGEKLTFVIPSKLSKNDEKQITSYTNELKQNFQNFFDIKVDILRDNKITTTISKENLIVFGNPTNNTILKNDAGSLPLKIKGASALIKGNKITTSNLSSVYLLKNPKNTNKLLMVVYWKNSIHQYDFITDNMDQYIVNYGNDEELRGQL